MKVLLGALAAGALVALVTVGVVALSGGYSSAWYYAGGGAALGYWIAKQPI